MLKYWGREHGYVCTVCVLIELYGHGHTIGLIRIFFPFSPQLKVLCSV